MVCQPSIHRYPLLSEHQKQMTLNSILSLNKENGKIIVMGELENISQDKNFMETITSLTFAINKFTQSM